MRSTVKCVAWRCASRRRACPRGAAGPRSSSMTAPASAAGSRGGIRQAGRGDDRLARAADGGDDLRHAARERLQRADRERLPARGEHVDVEPAQVVGGRRPVRLAAHPPGARMRLELRLPAARRRRSRSAPRGTAARIAGAASRKTSTPFSAAQRGHRADRRARRPAAGVSPRASRCGRRGAPRAEAVGPRRRLRSRSQTPMIAAVGGASSRSTRGRTPAAPRASRPRTGTRAACRRPAAARSSPPAARARPPWPNGRGRGRSRAARAPAGRTRARPRPDARNRGGTGAARSRPPARTPPARTAPPRARGRPARARAGPRARAPRRRAARRRGRSAPSSARVDADVQSERGSRVSPDSRGGLGGAGALEARDDAVGAAERRLISPAKLPRLETESLARRTVTQPLPRLRCTATRVKPLTAPVTRPETLRRRVTEVVRGVLRGRRRRRCGRSTPLERPDRRARRGGRGARRGVAGRRLGRGPAAARGRGRRARPARA